MGSEAEKLYTMADIDSLPDGERAELIDGTIYNLETPTFRHQSLVMSLSYEIKRHIKEKGGPCVVVPAPFAVRLNADDSIHVEPDISVICDRKKITDKGCIGAPDWVIEVVSPSTKKRDYAIKLFKYRSAGVRLYWIVDLDQARIVVYDFEHGDDMEDFRFQDRVPVSIYPDFYIDFSELSE